MNREDLRNVLKLMNEGYKEMNAEFEDKTDYVLDTSGTNSVILNHYVIHLNKV